MTTHLTPTRRSHEARQPWRVVARLLLGLLGAQLLAGAVFFTFFAAPEDGGVVTGFDWFVAIWALAVATALMVVAVIRHRRWTDVARWVVLVHLCWGLVKLVSYDELVPSLVSLAADVVVLLVLKIGTRDQD